MPSWAQRQFRASPRPRGNDAFDGHRHDLTRAHKLPCETIHLVLVILAARRNEVFPRHGAASHYIHNAEGHAYGQTFPVVQFDDRAFRGTDDQRAAPVERFRPPVKTPGKAGGLKRGDRSKRFLLFAYGELQQLKLLHLPVFFFLVPYVEPNFPFSYSYRAYKISSRPETRSCYFTNFFKMFRYLNSAFSF